MSNVPPPKISVVLTAYNRPQFLAEAIDSVLNQTLADFELIIVDDGSTDSQVRAVLQEYASKDNRIKPFHKNNAGVSAARNYGVMKACAPYVAFMDDDDISLPTRLEKQYAFLQAHPDVAAVVCTNGSFTDSPTAPLKKLNSSTEFLGASTMIRSAICGIAPYRSWFVCGEEKDLAWRLKDMQHQIAILPEILYAVRFHNEARLTRRSHQNYLYVVAAIISANNRKLGRADIIDQNATMEEVLRDGFPHCPPKEREQLLWGFRKSAKQLLRTREYGKLRQLIALCEQIATPTEQATLKKLKTRITLWAVLHARLAYFTAPTSPADNLV